MPKNQFHHFHVKIRACKKTDPLTFNGKQIQEEESIKYFDVILDKKLRFDERAANPSKLAGAALKVIPYTLVPNLQNLRQECFTLHGSGMRFYNHPLLPQPRGCRQKLPANSTWTRRREIRKRELHELLEVIPLHKLTTGRNWTLY